MGRLEVLFLGLTCCLAAACAAKLGAVYTEGGFVEGVNKKLSLLGGDSVDIFKGIPFATAKTLENPQRHPGWQGTLKATDFKKRCLQATITQDDTYGQEDCLYLNIWVPQGRKQVSHDLPVMVWIYGGAFLMGSGQGANFLKNYLYDGEEIATRGNVIVVTFNYRVGPLGFLSTGDANLPGNFGLRDQHMAIAWVKRNIAAFGGDPDNITIFGESAGAASVSLQTLSPYNKGLIRRAISQSGVALSPWAIQENPLFWAKTIAKKVGCPTEDTAKMAGCLKITDPRALTLAYRLPLKSQEYPIVHYLAFIPVVDGDFIPDDPINLYDNAADIDYLAGINDMDGHLFATVDVPAIDKAKQDVTEEDFYRLVSGHTVAKGLKGTQATFDIYTESWAQDPSQENMKKTVVAFETDILFLIPTEMALAQHRAHAKSAKTYSYLFSHPSRMPIYPKWMGADHADDLQYVFGKPFATPLGYRAQDRTVSKAMIAYWTNFAKSGDPNMGNSPVPTHWYPYTTENGNYLDINKKITSTSMKEHLREKFLKFWAVTFEMLPTVVGDHTPPEDDSEAAPVPPTDDSQGGPVPPTDDSQTTPVPPTDNSQAGDSVEAQMPGPIGF
uniref:Bile salt-activated lipase n=1 Tax=Rattus norvegicus TaxID=10116 RepID=CEL_RAT|nr:RecName: Full=Bile salt-activated lipase; Short=BAL; AltName: Full=Bile salt-stimulated lipase; Short=BSSL; AltName: Full=Carboxyl ester lipase; AltName: Full=Cholesterol esterase; AltName: Full=Pancreatic lysophospholipase; AltName: Full=Sterol esterase; Flags: Precursor [Rattus norvegicus]CAA34189.1 cholesterol esterase preprotein (AA -20 to 592) [Rattus norvegicus]